MKRLIFVGVFILFVSSGWAQSQESDPVIDSIKNVLSKPLADSVRVNSLLDLAANYYRVDPKEANKLATEAKELAQGSGYPTGVAFAHKALGMSYYFQGDWVNALVEWEMALEVFESIKDLNGVSNILNNLGAVHYNGGDTERALDFYLQSLKVAEETSDTLRVVTALINIGSVYLVKESGHDLAFDYYKRALPITKKLADYDAIGTVAVNLGEIYLGDTISTKQEQYQTKLDSALYYFETALDAYQNSATGNVAFALNSIGKVYTARGEYDNAIQYQREAFDLANAQDNRLEMAQALLSLASTFEKKGETTKAIESFKKAEKLSKEIEAYNLEFLAYNGLSDVYAKISDFENAYNYHVRFAEVKDTIYNAEMDKKLQAQTLSYEIEQKQGQISLLEKDQEIQEVELERQKAIRNGTALAGVLLLILIAGLYNRFKYTQKTGKIIAAEKERSDELLLNILPSETAEELKEKGSATPKFYPRVSVLFTDFKGFTSIAEKLSPQELVEELNECFISFDNIIDKHNLEKIKTIGDAYMCAGGIPVANEDNPFDVVKAALEIRDFMEELRAKRTAQGLDFWELRIGIHTGPVIAGVVGKNKFAYDIWGDAVNTASRMESSGIPGEVNISGATYEIIKEHFACKHRGKIAAKNKGAIDMYLVESLKSVKVETEMAV